MAFTGHGHFIPESSPKGIQPKQVSNCGGPGVCSECTADCIRVCGVPIEGNIYPAYVEHAGVKQLVGIATLSDNGEVLITEDHPAKKRES